MKRTLILVAMLVGVVASILFLNKRAAETPKSQTEQPTPGGLHQWPVNVRNDLEISLEEYDKVRAALARDEIPDGRQLTAALKRALEKAPMAFADSLKQGAGASEFLSQAKTLKEARAAFSEVSRAMVMISLHDSQTQANWLRFECPMAEGFAQWLQKSDKMSNPFMGPSMLTCGFSVPWSETKSAQAPTLSHEGHNHKGEDVAYYTCSMHPSVQQKAPGNCPLCSMSLTPVTFDEVESGTVRVDDSRRERIGIHVEAVKRGPFRRRVRAFGRITYDESRLHDISLRQGGWVQSLSVSQTGDPVVKGQTLMTLSGPELTAAQQEYVLALKSQQEAKGSSTPERADALVLAAKQKLRLWNIDDSTLDQLAKTMQPLEQIPFRSPVSGYVVEKDIVAGSAIMPGQRILRIAAMDRLWVQADVYENDIREVKIGQKTTISLPNQPQNPLESNISHLHHSAEAGTRATRVRMEIDNRRLELRPDTAVEVRWEVDLGERLLVPTSAVIFTGPRWVVFVDLGDGRLQPKEVKLGLRGEDVSEVLEGLQEGQKVVTAGNFFVAAESRLKAASTFWKELSDEQQ